MTSPGPIRARRGGLDRPLEGRARKVAPWLPWVLLAAGLTELALIAAGVHVALWIQALVMTAAAWIVYAVPPRTGRGLAFVLAVTAFGVFSVIIRAVTG